MRKLLASIDRKAVQALPELAALVDVVKAKNDALEQLKMQKHEAKAALKLAEKNLKKQLKSNPSKLVLGKKATKPAAALNGDATRTKKSSGKKAKHKAVEA